MGEILQINHGWIFIFLTLTLLVLTCLQANGSVLTRSFTLINQSRSYSIFFLRAISELVGLSLAATISTTLERIKWVMICRDSQSRPRFTDFLALQESTTILGLLSLATGRNVPSVKTRFWSAVRLILMVFIPAISILIMSQVDIQMVFSPIPSKTPYFGYWNQPMNASSAAEYTGFSDLVLSWKFASFLGDPTRSIDLSPLDARSKGCALNANTQEQDSSGCHRTYFVPGETLLITPELLLDPSFPKSDVILASDHRGFLLDFNAGDSATEFNATRECRMYSSRYLGVQAGAIRLCVGNSSPNELEARLVTCPGPIASQQKCLNDTSWHHNVDWTAKMSIFFQQASVAYSRTNGTILWHSIHPTPPTPVNISALDILEAYDHLLLDTTTLLHDNRTNLPLFSGSSFPMFLWIAEPEFSGDNAINPSTSNGVFSALQSLLAIPLYYAQSGVARRLIPGVMDAKAVSNPDLNLLFSMLSAPPERSSPASFAYHRYEIVVSLPTLIAYMVLSGVALLACSVAQMVISISIIRGNGMPQLSRFPTLDLFAHCTIEDDNRHVIYQGRSGVFPEDTSQRSLLSWLSTISVRWSKPFSIKDGLEFLGYASESSGGSLAKKDISAKGTLSQGKDEESLSDVSFGGTKSGSESPQHAWI